MPGTMKTKHVYTYYVDEAELELTCPWYAEEVLHEVLISKQYIIFGVLGLDLEMPVTTNLDSEVAEDLVEAWRNDDMFGYGVWIYDVNGHLITRDDECWGLAGREYAEQELKVAVDRAVARYKK